MSCVFARRECFSRAGRVLGAVDRGALVASVYAGVRSERAPHVRDDWHEDLALASALLAVAVLHSAARFFHDEREQLLKLKAENDDLKAQESEDRIRIQQLWTAAAKPWFPEGPTSANLALLKITPDAADYWDAPYSTMVRAVGMLASVVAGRPVGLGTHGSHDGLTARQD